jgi:hypothetical protein
MVYVELDKSRHTTEHIIRRLESFPNEVATATISATKFLQDITLANQ